MVINKKQVLTICTIITRTIKTINLHLYIGKKSVTPLNTNKDLRQIFFLFRNKFIYNILLENPPERAIQVCTKALMQKLNESCSKEVTKLDWFIPLH
jgi:hypothetical protein